MVNCACTLLFCIVSAWTVTASYTSIGDPTREELSRWVAEEAILEKIKQFIELGRPTSLEISPQVAMFYLLYEDPSSPSETIASKLIAAFENKSRDSSIILETS